MAGWICGSYVISAHRGAHRWWPRCADAIAAGNAEIDPLAAASASDRDSLNRVLWHLVSKDLFEEPAHDAHPDIAASFDALIGPAGEGAPDPEVPVNRADWDSIKTVVDVGGGTGAQLTEILRARPAVRGRLADLPRTVARSHQACQAGGVAGRVTIAAQRFFDPLPGGADLYI